nr:MAG TPA: hypothetical protein [Caudoviricetes sp.]
MNILLFTHFLHFLPLLNTLKFQQNVENLFSENLCHINLEVSNCNGYGR